MQENSIPIIQRLLFAKTFLSNSVRFYLPLFFASLGLSGVQTGILFAIGSLCSLVFSFFSGYLNDVFSPKKAITGGIMLFILYYIGMNFATDFNALVALAFIVGLGSMLVQISAESYIFKTKTKKEGEKFGRTMLYSAMGSATGFFLMGALLNYLGFQNLFLLAVAIWCFVLLYSMRVGELAISKVKLHHYKSDIFNPRMLLLIIVLFLFGMHWGAEATSYALFLKTDLGLDGLGTGLFMSIPVFILAAAALWVGKKIDRDKGKIMWLFFAGLLFSGLFHILMTYPSLPFSFAMRILHEVGDAIMTVVIYVGLAKILPAKRIGGGWGLITSFMILGDLTGSLVYGYLGGVFGYGFPLAASGAVMLIALIIAYAFRKTIFGK